MIEQTEINELLDSVDLESWLDAEGIKYKHTVGSRGPQLNVQECPFCHGSSWKVYIGRDSGLGNCFSGSCGKTFNKMGFIRQQLGDGTPFGAVIDHLRTFARANGWKAKRTTAVATTTKNKDAPRLPDSYALPINGKNLAYLANRGIDIATAGYFGLRFCKRGSFTYQLSDGMPRQQDYSNRILIPIYDLDGNLVSFQGRDILGTAERKYLFPPGYASTGEHLFNGHNVVGTKRVVMGEGAFDVMACKLALDADQALRDVVAIGSFGKHLSFGSPQSQLEKLHRLQKERGLEEVTFMWDGEVKATDDALEAGDRVRGLGLRVRIALLPKDKDPNEVPPAVVRKAFYEAITLSPTTAITLALRRRAA